MMSSDRHHHDASEPGDEGLRQALHRLADSAGGTPALSGAELRALAGSRRRRTRLAVAPAAAVAGLLAGITFAVAGGHSAHPGHGHTAPARSAVPVAPSAPHESAPPISGGGRASGHATTAPSSDVPTATASPHAPRPVLPGRKNEVGACAVAPKGETLVLLHALSVPGTLMTGTSTLFSAAPVSCVHGRLTPSGPPQQLEMAQDAVVTTTAPLGNGPASTPSTLKELAVELADHPDQVFGIRRNGSGVVIRLDEVYVP